VDEKKRPGQGGKSGRANVPRKPGAGLLGEKLKRLESRRSRRASRPAKHDDTGDARSLLADGSSNSVRGYGKYAEHTDSRDLTNLFPDTDVSGGEKRLATKTGILLTEENRDFLRGYSMGPVCGLYMANRVSWPLLLPFALGLIPLALLGLPMGAFIVMALACAFCPPAIALVCFHVGLVLLNRPWDIELLLLGAGAEPSTMAGYAYIGAGWLTLIYVLLLGNWSRRMRWKELRWSSFDAFQREEDLWYGLGGLLGIVVIALAVGIFALGGLDKLTDWFERFYYLNF